MRVRGRLMGWICYVRLWMLLDRPYPQRSRPTILRAVRFHALFGPMFYLGSNPPSGPWLTGTTSWNSGIRQFSLGHQCCESAHLRWSCSRSGRSRSNQTRLSCSSSFLREEYGHLQQLETQCHQLDTTQSWAQIARKDAATGLVSLFPSHLASRVLHCFLAGLALFPLDLCR